MTFYPSPLLLFCFDFVQHFVDVEHLVVVALDHSVTAVTEVVGWFISVSPNQTTIMRAMKPAIEKHGPSGQA